MCITNELSNAGTISGTTHTPLRLPLGQFPVFQPANASTDPAKDFTVSNGSTASLTQGRYRDIVLQPHSTLTLDPGIYDIRSLWLKSDSKLYFKGVGTVRIQNGFGADNGTTIGPVSGSTITASDIVFYVGGTDAQSSFSYAVNISPKSNVKANEPV